jgi:dienelactone hydrolase
VRRLGRSIVTAVLIALAGCTQLSLAPSEADIERTWSQALVALPAGRGPELVGRMGERAVVQRVAEMRLRGRYPLVVFLHGCTGIGDVPFFTELARLGYAVVVPDSFARRYRPLQCDPRTLRGGNNLFVYDFRATELTFALDQLSKVDWVDFDNLFLIGASEGAVAAALFRGEVFNARVLLQWTCHGQALVRGIAALPNEPVLAIVREGDPYYDPRNTPAQQGDCGAFMVGRPGSRSVVLGAAGGLQGHTLLDDPDVRAAIADFLGAAYRRGRRQ